VAADREPDARPPEVSAAEPETTASETETPSMWPPIASRACVRPKVSAAEPETTASETETPVEMTADREPDASEPAALVDELMQSRPREPVIQARKKTCS